MYAALRVCKFDEMDEEKYAVCHSNDLAWIK